jgi:hypothetical protein
MTFPHASYETYAALRDMDISHPDITPSDHEDSWRLGHMASWLRYGAVTGDLAPITANSKEDFDQLEPLTTSVILFGVNLGGKAIAKNLEDWRNFHTVNHNGDTKLKESLRMAKSKSSGWDDVPAFYMSDVFKLIPTKTGGELGEQITADLETGIDHVDRCAAILREELEICMAGAGGQAPTLVAMGDYAFGWLTGAKGVTKGDTRIAAVVDEVLGDGARKRVRQIPHGTSSKTYDERVAAFNALLEEAFREQQVVPAAS